jgi:inosine-uridine nucleoside N-ribohydrolase
LLEYNKDLALRFPNDLKDAVKIPNATSLYRQLLSNAEDKSITILTVGPLTNIYHLMRSEGDSVSSLTGRELINKKVKRLITAGGRLPEGSSYNFWMAPDKAEFVINQWPVEYWFIPNQLGDSVLTGTELIEKTPVENPVRMAYSLYRAAHPDRVFRPSWDQMGVLIAARGKSGLFKVHTSGGVTAAAHKIKWKPAPDKNHVWYQNDSSPEERRNVIEPLMIQPPKKRP